MALRTLRTQDRIWTEQNGSNGFVIQGPNQYLVNYTFNRLKINELH